MIKKTASPTQLKQQPEQIKFTDAKLKAYRRRGRTYKLRDTLNPKLMLLVSKRGTKSFIAQIRIKHNGPTTITYGKLGDINVATARKLHREAMELARQGINPNKVETPDKELTIQNLCNEYVETNNKLSDKTIELYDGLIRNHLNHDVFSVSFAELDENKFVSWHKKFKKQKKTQVANNCLKLLSATFNAQPSKLIKDAENPKRIIKRRKADYRQHTKVDIYLNPENVAGGDNEIERFLGYLWDITYGYSYPISDTESIKELPSQDQVYIDAIMMMFLTGLRVNAVITLKWRDVDFTKGVVIAQEKGKDNMKKTRIVPMSSYVYRLLRHREGQNEYGSRWVFPSRPLQVTNKDGKRNKKNYKGKIHITNPDHIFAKMEVRAKMYKDNLFDKCDRHALRRTIGRIAKHLGFDLDTMRTILDQANPSVTTSNYVGNPISTKRLIECYEECHKFIDNRLFVASGQDIPVWNKKKRVNLPKIYSPMMAMWGKPKIGLEPDEYITGFEHSGFAEKKTAFPELD